MFIWDDGESVTVTGSVDHAVLDAYNKAKDAGDDLSPFASYLGVPPEPQVDVQDEEVGVEESAPASEVETTDEGYYSNWSLAKLQGEAEARGLPKYGTKAEIVERLLDDDAAAQGVEE